MDQRNARDAVHLEYTEDTGTDTIQIEQSVQTDWSKEEGNALRKLDSSLIPLYVLNSTTVDLANGNYIRSNVPCELH